MYALLCIRDGQVCYNVIGIYDNHPMNKNRKLWTNFFFTMKSYRRIFFSVYIPAYIINMQVFQHKNIAYY